MANYVYWQSEPGLFTVGFYRDDDGEWETESDWNTRKEAGDRVHYLNGGENEKEN